MEARYERAKVSEPVILEILVPKLSLFDTKSMPLFTVREIARGISKLGGTGKLDTVTTIDFFYMETINTKDYRQMEQLETDLNLPFAKGCSEFLEATQPQTSAQSFLMTFVQASSLSLVTLAYDHEFAYLRKEVLGQSVGIWDINEGLYYHLDQTLTEKIYNSLDIEVPLEPCSVLTFSEEDVIDPSSPSTQWRYLEKPYTKVGANGGSLDVIEFLGAKTIYYVGQSTVRDMPCLVFETILPEAPKIFSLDVKLKSRSPNPQQDFLVQYYIFKTPDNSKEPTKNEYKGKPGAREPYTRIPLVGNRFWPAQIDLYIRHKESSKVKLLDSLGVQDFHWGLYGWQRKPSELFMMPQCFNNEDEQVKLAIALQFKQMDLIENRRLLAGSKYKLEMDLQNSLFKLFAISRMHLTDYEISLTKHNALANLVISDRRPDRKVIYYGQGELPSFDSYVNNRVLLQTAVAISNVNNCLLTASHVADISLVIYCPRRSATIRPTCTAVFDESQPVIKMSDKPVTEDYDELPEGPEAPCQVFRFEPQEIQKLATNNLDKFKRLDDFQFNFQVAPLEVSNDDITGSMTTVKMLEGFVQDYDIKREQQLVTIRNYKFALPQDDQRGQKDQQDATKSNTRTNVRYFGSMAYDNLGDCSRMCNLDSSCRSYSYCSLKVPIQDDTASTSTTSSPGDSEGRRCVLSSLDLRKNDVGKQMMRSKVEGPNSQIEVLDEELSKRNQSEAKYKLDMMSSCNIHERDFLSMFKQTDELLRVSTSLASQVVSASSVSDCARLVVELEDRNRNEGGARVGSMFAFCSHTGACLSDESLFSVERVEASTSDGKPDAKDVSTSYMEDVEPAGGELSCQMFRKRYQTYFNISLQVVKRPVGVKPEDAGESSASRVATTTIKSGPIEQIELQLSTVEECAQACWNNFGHVCLSFDFCSPGLCLVNAIDQEMGNSFDPSTVEYETRAGCLAYKRDLKWDQLRREHLVGSHKLLEFGLSDRSSARNDSVSGLLVNIILLCASAILFGAGLLIGRVFNERLENVSGIRRSRRTDSTQNIVGLFSINNGNTNGGDRKNSGRMASSSKYNIENEIYEDPDAIRMEDFSAHNNNSQASSSDGDDQHQNDVANEPQLMEHDEPSSPKPMPKGPNFIDVPELF